MVTWFEHRSLAKQASCGVLAKKKGYSSGRCDSVACPARTVSGGNAKLQLLAVTGGQRRRLHAQVARSADGPEKAFGSAKRVDRKWTDNLFLVSHRRAGESHKVL